MSALFSADRIRFLINRFRERLWVKPLMVCLVSIAMAFVAAFADGTPLTRYVPEIAAESVETLLSIMASSMLVIATFSVASMVSAYASASNTATPRSFALVVADDASQNALSTFVGAFIFSIVALTALKNGYFGKAGVFILFALTVTGFSIVIVTFVRWVDRIARLGRMGSTIDKVEKAATRALERRRDAPTLRGAPVGGETGGTAVLASSVGYVQHIDMSGLQAWAEEHDARVRVAALPGTLATPDRALAHVRFDSDDGEEPDCQEAAKAFEIGHDRLFDDDPRFGLVVLSEIAGRALSPAVNDPGTAIEIIGTLVRLFTRWCEPSPEDEEKDDRGPKYDRVEVPELAAMDLFDDAFTAIARDGAGTVEVALRLHKALRTLATIGCDDVREAAEHHGRLALKRSEKAMAVEEDLELVRDVAGW